MTYRQRVLAKLSNCCCKQRGPTFVVSYKNVFGQVRGIAAGSSRYHAWKNAWLKLTGEAD